MEDKKYELTDNTIEYNERTLYQIKALKDFGDVKTGDLGGYIEKEYNLSQDGNCWVYDKAKVYHNAKVYDNAKVYGEAKVYGNSEIYDNAKVYGEAKVFNYAEISENSDIYGQAQVYGQTQVYGNAKVYDNAKVYKKAQVYENAKIYEDAEIYDEAKVFGKAEIYGEAEVYNEAQVYDNARVFGNAQVYNKAKIYDKAEIFTDIEIGGETEVKGNEKLFNHSQYIDNLAKVYGEAEVKDNAKVYGTTKAEDVFRTYGDTKLYEEHCSEIVDKLKLQDELPNFQVISQKGVLYEKNSENNNITEIKNFVENLKGEEFWDNMSLKDIRNWKELRNDEVVSIVYESKDDRDNITLEEFTDYNDYAKDTVINALSKEYVKNPDTIESLRKDILDKVPNKEVVKEKVEVVKDIEKEHLEKEEKVANKTFGYRSDF